MVFSIQGESYVLTKLLLLMVAAAVVVIAFRGAVRIKRARGMWRWWAPAVVIVVWTLLSEVAPWNPRFDPGDMTVMDIVVAATATAITAGIGEELFYRRWLQTRLEALLGAWPGVGLASLAFALMHLASHGSGRPLLDVATVIVVQGTFGLFVGVMWMRYRNLAAIIVTHIIVNGWGVAVALLT